MIDLIARWEETLRGMPEIKDVAIVAHERRETVPLFAPVGPDFRRSQPNPHGPRPLPQGRCGRIPKLQPRPRLP